MNNEVDPEILAKHFTEVPNQAIQPVKAHVVDLPQGKELKRLLETYFATTKATYYNTFQNGKMLARMKEYKTPVDVLPVLSALVIQGIKSGNTRAGISNEALSQYFSGLTLMFQLLETNIKTLIEQKGTADSQSGFDMTELLAVLSGFLVEKLHD